MSRILKDPLLHFLLIGLAIFVAYQVAGSDPEPANNRGITVTADRIEQLATQFSKTWQRPPTEQELKGLVDDFVIEEIYVREARAMGIDQDDTVIRRRLRQKLEFLTADIAALSDPDEAELAAFLEANPERFTAETQYTFQQVYFNPEKHQNPGEYARARVELLRSGVTVEGDSNLLPEAFEDVAATWVDRTFGRNFADQLDELEPGSWQGPLNSGYGLHAVRLDRRVPGRVPELGEIRDRVQREWQREREAELRKAFDEKLRAKYEVRIELPEESGEAETSAE